jgi:hypothetical protein
MPQRTRIAPRICINEITSPKNKQFEINTNMIETNVTNVVKDVEL